MKLSMSDINIYDINIIVGFIFSGYFAVSHKIKKIQRPCIFIKTDLTDRIMSDILSTNAMIGKTHCGLCYRELSDAVKQRIEQK